MYTSSFLPKRENNQLVFGIRAVIEAIKSGQEMESIYIQRGLRGELFHELRELMNEYQLSAQLVPVEKLNRLTAKNHQGVVAFISPITYHQIEDIIPAIYEKGETPLILVLDGITDVRNIGAIARSALCCGAQALIIPDKGVGALNAEAVKSSAGALEHIHVCRVNSLIKAVDTLHLNGIQVFTSEMRADKKIYELSLTDPCCVIMGDEGKGVQPYLAKAADAFFTIPMAGTFDSFNVGVATGIVLYEAMKQRLLQA